MGEVANARTYIKKIVEDNLIHSFLIITNLVQDALKITPKTDYGECNHRTLSDGAKIYESHNTCKACRDGDKRRNCNLNRSELQ